MFNDFFTEINGLQGFTIMVEEDATNINKDNTLSIIRFHTLWKGRQTGYGCILKR
ncbi:MAG: hypothetical protein M3Z01_03320 [Thermoproteota archaeon]|nr:hypothetical protein [Thermoproteota archaeon]